MDPASGGIGEAAKQLMQEMQKAQADMQQQAQGPQEGFQQTLQAQQTQQADAPGQVDALNDSKRVQGTQKASEVLLKAKVDGMTPSTQVGNAAAAEQSEMLKMVDGLIKGQDEMSKIMDVALSGKQMSPPELLAMQAKVYRFSQELELTSKVVEKSTSGIKQTMNTQV